MQDTALKITQNLAAQAIETLVSYLTPLQKKKQYNRPIYALTTWMIRFIQ